VAPTIQELGIDKLDVDERLAVAHQLFDSVVAELEAEGLSDELRAELDRRLDLDAADPARGIPWEKVKADARARRKP
jgi:putative addiction module component (TIGR02574 family)